MRKSAVIAFLNVQSTMLKQGWYTWIRRMSINKCSSYDLITKFSGLKWIIRAINSLTIKSFDNHHFRMFKDHILRFCNRVVFSYGEREIFSTCGLLSSSINVMETRTVLRKKMCIPCPAPCAWCKLVFLMRNHRFSNTSRRNFKPLLFFVHETAKNKMITKYFHTSWIKLIISKTKTYQNAL